jgi:hypothetical protein
MREVTAMRAENGHGDGADVIVIGAGQAGAGSGQLSDADGGFVSQRRQYAPGGRRVRTAGLTRRTDVDA